VGVYFANVSISITYLGGLCTGMIMNYFNKINKCKNNIYLNLGKRGEGKEKKEGREKELPILLVVNLFQDSFLAPINHHQYGKGGERTKV
jgi:hypothetical protein